MLADEHRMLGINHANYWLKRDRVLRLPAR
jgi:hypothetical protein